MKLFEVLKKHVEYEWFNLDHNHRAAEFVVNGSLYHVNFVDSHYTVDKVHKACTEISFAMFDENDEMVDHITGTGGAFQVLGTVMEIVDDWLDHHYNTKAISFSAAEPSRQRVYARFVKKLEGEGWRSVNHDHESGPRGKVWVLVKQ